MEYGKFVNTLIDAAQSAGDVIMKYYGGKINIKMKQDNSPVTRADIAANDIIVEMLGKISPDIPIVSEENETNIKANDTDMFWIVDPLDGTKSYINKTDQFTVNIALVENGLPVLGIVYVPVTGEMFYTGADGHAYKKQGRDELPEIISVRKPAGEGMVVVTSKSHRSVEEEIYIKDLPEITGLNVARLIEASSSLKFCLLAEGAADVYPRFGPTKEWDTAAGHAVLIAAGGLVENAAGGTLTYGKEKFKNPHFVAWGQKPR